MGSLFFILVFFVWFIKGGILVFEKFLDELVEKIFLFVYCNDLAG